MNHEEENNVEEVVVDESTSDIIEVEEVVEETAEAPEVEETADEPVQESWDITELPYLADHKADRTGPFAENFNGMYDFLAHNELPVMVAQALKHYGLKEVKGEANNPIILDWGKQLGGWQGESYTADSIPWCGLFMAKVAMDSSVTMPAKMVWLRAKDWAKVGKRSDVAGLGDILIFDRKGGGHVGLYICEDETHYHVLGGNQRDAVSITRIAKDRIADIRRVAEHEGVLSVTPWTGEATGEESTNEA